MNMMKRIATLTLVLLAAAAAATELPKGVWPVSQFLGSDTNQVGTNFLSATNPVQARAAITAAPGDASGNVLSSNAVPFVLATNGVTFGFNALGQQWFTNTVTGAWGLQGTNGHLKEVDQYGTLYERGTNWFVISMTNGQSLGWTNGNLTASGSMAAGTSLSVGNASFVVSTNYLTSAGAGSPLAVGNWYWVASSGTYTNIYTLAYRKVNAGVWSTYDSNNIEQYRGGPSVVTNVAETPIAGTAPGPTWVLGQAFNLGGSWFVGTLNQTNGQILFNGTAVPVTLLNFTAPNGLTWAAGSATSTLNGNGGITAAGGNFNVSSSGSVAVISTGVYYGNGGGLTNVVSATNALHLLTGDTTTNLTLVNATGNLTGNAATATSSFFVIGTNFLNKNTMFVDAGTGSDANVGSEGFPWATIAKAQTSTPSGWTVAVAPGSYVDKITNFNVQWWLSAGTSASLLVTNVAGYFTNTVYGNGNITLNSMGYAYSNQVLTVFCNDFSFASLTKQGPGFAITAYCTTAGLQLLSSGGLLLHGNSSFGGPGANDYLNVYASGNIYVGPIAPDFVNPSTLSLDCKSIILSVSGTRALTTNSIWRAQTCFNNVGGTINFGGVGQKFVWAVGQTICNGFALTFPTGEIFINDPYFDIAPTATSPAGEYQHP